MIDFGAQYFYQVKVVSMIVLIIFMVCFSLLKIQIQTI